MPDSPLSRVADFFTKPHILPSGRPEPVALPPPSSGDVPPGSEFPLPPMLQGLYRTLYPTPAETGELPPQYWPKQPASTGASVANALYPQG